MSKLIRNISFLLALAVVFTSCYKDEEFLDGTLDKAFEKSYDASADDQDDVTGSGPSSLPSNQGGPIVDDEDDENDDDGNGITDDEDDENDDDTPNKKVQN